jgi:uncharacterized protein YqeY
MSLAADLKKAMFAAMKAKNVVEKEILRVALGEITKTGEEIDDSEVQAILKKLIKSNREAQGAIDDPEKKAQLEQEIEILQAYLPQSLDLAQIVAALSEVADSIKGAPGQGPAMGIAMKVLKQSGAVTEAADVAKAVTQIRGT